MATTLRPKVSDSELIALYLEGSQAAFAELHKRYQSRLEHFVYKWIGDRERAEDVVQETFLRVARHVHRFDTSKKFSSWVYTIAKNLSKNELRDRGRHQLDNFSKLGQHLDEDMPLEFADPKASPDEALERKHQHEIILDGIGKLPSHHRKVIELRELGGLTYEDVAHRTGTTLGTVKSRLNRARRALGALIKHQI